MDPASHLLFGRALAYTLERRVERRGIIAALVIGSVLPDIDSPLAFYRFDLYLRAHAAGTHSLVGTVIGAVLLALVLHRLVRGSRPVLLFAASWVGTLGHVFWDIADPALMGDDGADEVYREIQHRVKQLVAEIG